MSELEKGIHQVDKFSNKVAVWQGLERIAPTYTLNRFQSLNRFKVCSTRAMCTLPERTQKGKTGLLMRTINHPTDLNFAFKTV